MDIDTDSLGRRNEAMEALKNNLASLQIRHFNLVKAGVMTANYALDREDEIHAQIDRLKTLDT